MRRWAISLAVAGGALALLSAQSSYEAWHSPEGKAIVGSPIFCPTGNAREAVPCGSMASPINVMTGPFVRATLDPNIFDGVTTTPKQFPLTKPPGATTYRFVNPCDVDVRIRKVGSMSETVTPTTGIRYLARTVEVVGTSNPTFISIMAVKAPSEPCAPELQYGNGS